MEPGNSIVNITHINDPGFLDGGSGKKDPTIYLYFDNKPNLRKSKNWVESNHLDVK
ncbi:4003_t:CDS:2, partial [Acaulospora colombiana]